MFCMLLASYIDVDLEKVAPVRAARRHGPARNCTTNMQATVTQIDREDGDP